VPPMSASDQDTIDRAAARLVDAGLADEAALRGCRDDEIDQLEGSLGIKLPSTYRQFLARMGRSAGAFLSGTDFLFADLPELRRQAERLLEEANVSFCLAEADFVFAVHQGYQFLYFTTGQLDDPAVWHFAEGVSEPRCAFEHFSQWLSACTSDEIAMWQDITRHAHLPSRKR
jgi:SMI1-KNR4 cell-wall